MVGQQAVCTDADEGFADEPVHCLADEGAGGIFVIRLQGIAQVLGQTGFEVLALTRTVIGMHQVRLCFFTDVEDADKGVVVLGGDLSEVVGEVEVKRVFAGFGDADEVDVLPKAARGSVQFDGQVFLLVFAKEEPDVAVIGVKGVQLGGVGLGVLKSMRMCFICGPLRGVARLCC